MCDCVFCQASWHYEPTLYSAFEWAHFANTTSSKPLALLQTHINMLPPPCFKVRPMQSLWHSYPGPHQKLKSRQMAFCFIWIKNMLLVLIRLSFVRRNCAILCPLIRKSPLLSGLRTAKADSCENLLLLFQFKVVKIVHQRTPEVSRQAFRGLHLQAVCISLSQDKRGKERKPCGVFF